MSPVPVAVRYRDSWYFIDDRDLATKRFFKLLGAMWSMAESANKASGTPVLTVPVSG
jgi:hypothetical protein